MRTQPYHRQERFSFRASAVSDRTNIQTPAHPLSRAEAECGSLAGQKINDAHVFEAASTVLQDALHNSTRALCVGLLQLLLVATFNLALVAPGDEGLDDFANGLELVFHSRSHLGRQSRKTEGVGALFLKNQTSIIFDFSDVHFPSEVSHVQRLSPFQIHLLVPVKLTELVFHLD